MKKIIILLLSFVAISSVQAQELSIIGHGFSKHLENHNFNERNYGWGLRLKKDDFAIQAGTFHNSIRNYSKYVVVDWSPFSYNMGGCMKLEAGAFAGGTTGYKYVVTPVLGLQSSIKCDNIFARLRVEPDPFYTSKAIVAIEVGVVLIKF
jgi:hypothetical protein